MKGRSLWERPAFLRSPPGCGVIEALGCVGRGLRLSGLGAAGGLGGTLGGYGHAPLRALPNWDEIPFGYELRRQLDASYEYNLTNGPTLRHLQNCISHSDYPLCFLTISACSGQQIGEKGDSVPRLFRPLIDNYLFISMTYETRDRLVTAFSLQIDLSGRKISLPTKNIPSIDS